MASKPILLKVMEKAFRSGLEEKVDAQLKDGGVDYEYEGEWVHYIIPERRAKYLPDFASKTNGIIIEAKGRFGHNLSDSNGAAERQKLILLKAQHPERDFRIVFQNANKPIYKGSKTTYAKWAADHGFLWSDKGRVPPAWVIDMKTKGTN